MIETVIMEEEDIEIPMDTINDMESAGFIQKDVVKSIDTNILSLDDNTLTKKRSSDKSILATQAFKGISLFMPE